MLVSPSRTAPLLLAFALAACSPQAPKEEAPLVRTQLVGDAQATSLRYTGVVRARTESDLGFRVGGKVSVAEEERQRRLLEVGAVSRSSYDQALANAQSARAAAAAARSGASQARNQAGYATLYADADGVVTEVLAQPGQVVGAGMVVARLARSGSREAALSIPESQVGDLPRQGQAWLYGSSEPMSAQLRELSGAADPLSRTFDARFVLSRTDLPLGSTVTVALQRPTMAEVQVPLSALLDRGRGPGVWVVREGRVTFRPVKVTTLGEEQAAIAAGSLAQGDRIVTLGPQLLREGQAVRTASGAAVRS
ncbi:MAG: efflux transporter, family, subunit [Caulobacter sp.]|nr:efflux transporter, family, subunit [Caulobacter sp.]